MIKDWDPHGGVHLETPTREPPKVVYPLKTPEVVHPGAWKPDPATRLITGFPEGEVVVSMCVWNEWVMVATNWSLYAYHDNELHLIRVHRENDNSEK